MTSNPTPEIKTKQTKNWVRVFADVKGEDVSHLGFGRRRLQVGAYSAVTMAAIGGVGTDKEHRRKGLARRVLSRAMDEIRRDEYAFAGLYTSRKIVAHRLYRQFGFVDVVRRRPQYKLLDPQAYTRDFVAGLAQRSSGLGARRRFLTVTIDEEHEVNLVVDGRDVSVLERKPTQVDLSLSLSQGALLQLAQGSIRLPFAEAARLLTWSGDEETFRALVGAVADAPAVHEE
ncbi:MAG: GNAT family N-acetyltransferase [Armatimonadetes bacterium]|nr:GNAT family N-acetyltransferase [Armatimonadota bacterium]